MNVVIISKEKYEEMVNKLNRLSDRVNEILSKREAQPLDGQSGSLPAVAHQFPYLADASRQRYAGLLPDRA